MRPLHLHLRTPTGALLDRPVDAIVAEDRSGWFGIRPGREDLLAVLPAGLLVFRAGPTEGFVALSGGLLDLRGGRCTVLTPEAVWSEDLDAVADTLEAHSRRRVEQAAVHRGVVADLAREALRRLVREEAVR